EEPAGLVLLQAVVGPAEEAAVLDVRPPERAAAVRRYTHHLQTDRFAASSRQQVERGGGARARLRNGAEPGACTDIGDEVHRRADLPPGDAKDAPTAGRRLASDGGQLSEGNNRKHRVPGRRCGAVGVLRAICLEALK